jgi:hypothetical protein
VVSGPDGDPAFALAEDGSTLVPAAPEAGEVELTPVAELPAPALGSGETAGADAATAPDSPPAVRVTADPEPAMGAPPLAAALVVASREPPMRAVRPLAGALAAAATALLPARERESEDACGGADDVVVPHVLPCGC